MTTATLYTQANTDKNLIQSFYARGQMRCIIEEIVITEDYGSGDSVSIGGILFPKGATFQFANIIIGPVALGTTGATTFMLGHSSDEDYFGTVVSSGNFTAVGATLTMRNITRLLNPTDKAYQMTLEWNKAVDAVTSGTEKSIICAVYYVID